MSILSTSFTSVTNGNAIAVKAGEDVQYFLSGTFVATILVQSSENGTTWATETSKTAAASGTLSNTTSGTKFYRFRCDAFTSGTAVTTIQNAGVTVDNAFIAQYLGTVPVVAGLQCVAGYSKVTGHFRLDYTFSALSITHTDAAASGSSGSLKILDFVEGAVLVTASRSDLVITADNVLDSGTTLAMKYGFGSAACDAGDGALTGTEVDYAAISGTLTATAHVCTSASLLAGAGTAKDGTATAADIYFNESATAATSVANGVLLVTGTATFTGIMIGDD